MHKQICEPFESLTLDDHLQNVWKTFLGLARRGVIDKEDLLLDDDSDDVRSTLEYRKTIDHEASREDKWPEDHFKFCQTKHVPMSALTPCEKHGTEWLLENEWYLTLADRERAVLCYFLAIKCNEDGNMQKGAPNSADLSQNLHRFPIGRGKLFQTVVPNAKIWHVGRKRLLTGREMLRLQGMPTRHAPQVMGNTAASLGGNGWPGPLVVALMLSVMVWLPIINWADDCEADMDCIDDLADLDL